MPILDSSAVLAVLFEEPGHQRVAGLLSDAIVSSVSFAEIVGVYSRRTGDLVGTASVLDDLGLSVAPFERSLAYEAGILEPPTRRLGFSLGDRACLALAASLGLHVLMTDRNIAAFSPSIGVTAELIR